MPIHRATTNLKGDTMAEFLFKKNVDQSVLEAGMTIPRDSHEKFLRGLGITLSRGNKEKVKVVIGNEEFEAIITNVDFADKWNRNDTLQIRYASGSMLCKRLNEVFGYSASVINERKNHASASSSSVLNGEYIDVYAIDRLRIEFRCSPTRMKEEFIKYIGHERDLNGYQRSYKLVFLQCFFALLDKDNQVDAEQLTEQFRHFYVDRKRAGLVPDIDVDNVIENVEKSTLKSIFSLIQRNPYNAISGKGYIKLIDSDGKPYYRLAPEIYRTLDPVELHMIEGRIAEKINYYYSRIDEGQNEEMKNIVDKILNEYQIAKNQTFAGHELGTFFRSGIPETLYGTGIVDSKTHLITGSVGQGNWATIPWICIFDRKITTSAQRGVYIVYLLSKDGNTLYLTFNQGCTDLSRQHSKQETIRIMQERAKEIRNRIDARGFSSDDGMNLGESLPDLGNYYQKGTIFYKAYKKGAVPENGEIRDDLVKMMQIYDDYVRMENGEDEEKAWLLTWNPNNWKWDDYFNAVWFTLNGLEHKVIWSCSSTHVSIGDRVYLMVYGVGDQSGIVGSGKVIRESFEDDHWDAEKSAKGIKWRKIGVAFDRVINYQTHEILKQSKLKTMFPDQQWSPQSSGISIKREYLHDLEIEWNKVKMAAKTLPGGEEEVSTRDAIQGIKQYIEGKGFSYPEGLIENFYLSLKSKPFVILAGTSGTGKTRLVKLFAEAVGATRENGRYQMVSVRPDWSDSSDLFGHVDLHGKFISGAIIDFVKKAEIDRACPYFLCLDEMNLARVEYYLSDILSIIETRDLVGREIMSDPLISETYYGSDYEAAGRYGTVRLPENLYIIGTVNMDETTFPFSRKVLDRANTIEFSYVDLMPRRSEEKQEVRAQNLPNAFLKTEYLLLSQCDAAADDVDTYCLELQSINKILQKANAHVGYRVRDEIVFYLLNNKKAELISQNEAMDNEIMQKILPRIQGSSASIKNMLCELFKICAGDYAGYQTEGDDLGSKMLRAAQDVNCKYKKSAEKIAFMVRRYEEDGFTSYWL